MSAKHMVVAILLSGAAAVSSAGTDKTAYLDGWDGSGTSSWNDAARWRIGSRQGAVLGEKDAPLPSDYDYFVSAGTMMRTPNAGDTAFAGKSLTLGAEGDNGSAQISLCPTHKNAWYDFGDLRLVSGTLQNYNAYYPIIKGNITVENPKTRPCQLWDNAKESNLTIDGKVIGGSDAWLWIYSQMNQTMGYPARNMLVRFVGTALADYAGMISCHQFTYDNRTLSTNGILTATIASGTVVSPVTVDLHDHGCITCLSATDVFTIATLMTTSESEVVVVYDYSARTGSCVRVTDSFLPDGGAPLKIRFDAHVVIDSKMSFRDMPATPVLRLPKGTAFSEDDFELIEPELQCFPVFEIAVEDDAEGYPTVYVCPKGNVVYATADDSSANYTDQQDSFRSGAHWSDGFSPANTNLYYSTKSQRAYGTSPNFGNGATLAHSKGWIYLFDKDEGTRFEDLRIVGNEGTVRVQNYAGAGVNNMTKMSGHVLVKRSDERDYFAFTIDPTASCYLEVASEISGATPLCATVNSGHGYVRLTGDNLKFAGRMFFTHDTAEGSDAAYVEVAFPTAAALGGDCAAWKYNGHGIGKYAMLRPTASLTLNRANCGFAVEGHGVFQCDEGIDFGIDERFVWIGSIEKKGPGTLSLGGAAPYFEKDKGTTPVAGHNALAISAGQLKVTGSESLQGVAVSFASGTSLAIGLPAEGDAAALAATGLKDTIIDDPLSIADTTLPVYVYDPLGSVPRKGLRTIGLLTVKTSVADAYRGKLALANTPYPGYQQQIVELKDDAAGTTTFSVQYKRGLLLLIK